MAAAAFSLFLFASDAVQADDSGFVGMHVQGMSTPIARAMGMDRATGVLVRNVSLGGPADKAGFRRGDLIVRMAGRPVDSFQILLEIVRGVKAGQTVRVVVLRLGEEIVLKLTAAPWPESRRVAKGAFTNIPEAGLTMAALTPQVRKRFGLRWATTGVVVTLVDDAKAKATDIRRGEVIVQVAQSPVWLPQQVLDGYQAAKKEKRPSLLLLVEGSQGFRFSLLPVK